MWKKFVDWIYLAQDIYQMLALVNRVMNLGFIKRIWITTVLHLIITIFYHLSYWNMFK
jgi:hypothetical protein